MYLCTYLIDIDADILKTLQKNTVFRPIRVNESLRIIFYLIYSLIYTKHSNHFPNRGCNRNRNTSCLIEHISSNLRVLNN